MSAQSLADDDYIIGANSEEIARLGSQHAIWRETTLAAWRRAGVKPGMTILDIGAGPGYASFDLARLVGPEGRVIAIDQSPLFLQALEQGARQRGLENIETVQADLAEYAWPAEAFDAIWSRWCLSFLPDIDRAISGLARSLKPGGVFCALEYGHYQTMRLEPQADVFDRFLAAVEASWRHFDGDPNVARRFPALFRESGLALSDATPHVFAAKPGDVFWSWPMSWFAEAPARLIELGFFSAEDGRALEAFLAERQADPASFMVTPMVLETIAHKPV